MSEPKDENSARGYDYENENNNTKSGNGVDTKDEDYGYYFYPERGGTKPKTFYDRLWSTDTSRDWKCESNVLWCIRRNPMVKLLMRAMKSHGCEINLRRHISCEDCLERVNGGFDPVKNQVVICQNNTGKRSICCNVLAHEFTHMFDYCRAKVDFKNIEHLACTEIRAANLMHCSFAAAFASGDASPFNYKQQHATCVKAKALHSILMVRNVTPEEGIEAVNKVFDKCYKDLEPVGRRSRRNSRDPDCALVEGTFYGYI
ncbi:mitochondrial inner membrane protease ATP23 homolog [Patella vulgata]|uniref:mitochondrial inner membrane protease ATP23 homolog n=1 Tax=Patella vulgata TaxID=6465 RepID=UPI00218099AB|nr:mitochondrial inner membrane protease ATP23 homolog [Patella vulgata]